MYLWAVCKMGKLPFLQAPSGQMPNAPAIHIPVYTERTLSIQPNANQTLCISNPIYLILFPTQKQLQDVHLAKLWCRRCLWGVCQCNGQCKRMGSESHSVVSNCLWSHGIVHGVLQARIWSGQLFPSPGDHPNPGIEPRSPTLQADSLPAELPGKPKQNDYSWQQTKGRYFFSYLLWPCGNGADSLQFNKHTYFKITILTLGDSFIKFCTSKC